MAAAVIDSAEFAAGGAVEFEELAVGGVEGVGEDLGFVGGEQFRCALEAATEEKCMEGI